MVGGIISLSKVEGGDMELQKFAAADQYEASLEKTDTQDTFIVDIDGMSPSKIKDNHPANTRISVMLHRNFSRNESTSSASSRATDGSSTGRSGGFDPDKSIPDSVMCIEQQELDEKPQQIITITTENRSSSRMYLKHHTFFINPRRVLFFFATLSSMGTIILIYFTLSVGKLSGDSNS